MNDDWLKDIDLHCRPVRVDEIIVVLQECRALYPGCWVGRSGNNTGNLCVYDEEGNYFGVINLGATPSFSTFML